MATIAERDPDDGLIERHLVELAMYPADLQGRGVALGVIACVSTALEIAPSVADCGAKI
ncbi:hypothetical protein [Mesorhizobium sp. WSM3879]|uniref:hypothetical protein n=1 Tax=Mesorhizobium sp. WSM3879 TaxID=2029406 RepID=UPI0015CD4C27|nr:hypothetical protein [Mesorhizobium sp. WSM3879]